LDRPRFVAGGLLVSSRSESPGPDSPPIGGNPGFRVDFTSVSCIFLVAEFEKSLRFFNA